MLPLPLPLSLTATATAAVAAADTGAGTRQVKQASKDGGTSLIKNIQLCTARHGLVATVTVDTADRRHRLARADRG